MRHDRMPDTAFKLMNLAFKLMDLFHRPGKKLNTFGIQQGFTVIDYGCGPGRYLKTASELAGPSGKVYAADIHELAIENARSIAEKHNLGNVETVLITEYSCPLEDETADLLYALDMFHMVSKPEPFLRELHRLVKKNGILILEDGHQPRKVTKAKLDSVKIWDIVDETKQHLKCRPK
ncbi:MAG TPA: class I SAM-dependent methyltransferase [Spirochaetota bacterium]|nr:class I SAM-dependent methyltransferase [Spirochaetota bacterium]